MKEKLTLNGVEQLLPLLLQEEWEGRREKLTLNWVEQLLPLLLQEEGKGIIDKLILNEVEQLLPLLLQDVEDVDGEGRFSLLILSGFLFKFDMSL